MPYLNRQQLKKVGICYRGCNTILLLADKSLLKSWNIKIVVSGFELKEMYITLLSEFLYYQIIYQMKNIYKFHIFSSLSIPIRTGTELYN